MNQSIKQPTTLLPSVAILMSGGVDSSVAAALLVSEGRRVVGLTLKLWDAEDDDHARKICCTTTMARDAGKVCAILGIPHYTIDLREDFKREVIDRFEQDYLAGRTPNPCVQCNSKIKWGKVWEKVQSLGLERIATGHYARIERDAAGHAMLCKGLDSSKDQSYFLWEIPSSLLEVTLFPLGGKKKEEVRDLARQLNLPVAEKEESQEVCFIPKDDYRGWLLSRQPDLKEGSLSGNFIDESGHVIGTHSGYPFFTVGQRKGLGLGGGRKLFVTRIDPTTRDVHVGPEEDANRHAFELVSSNVLSNCPFEGENGYQVKIRYRDGGVPARVNKTDRGTVEVVSDQAFRSLTPGQSAVIYLDDRVVAGGVIA
jgi:tRNA-specific 2-thiouridylase